ncbi:MAG: ABC transporter permease [Planctomycetota bacterium]
MKATLWLAWQHLRFHRWRNLLLVSCLALVAFLPWLGRGLLARYQRDLNDRASRIPLLVGEPGDEFGLCLGALFFKGRDWRPMDFGEVAAWNEPGRVLAVPLVLGHKAASLELVGTSLEYFSQLGLVCREGRLPVRPGEVVVGAEAARRNQWTVGSTLRSDPPAGFGLQGHGSQALTVTGVLELSHGPDDRVLFTGLATGWWIDGLLHGHDEATRLANDDPAQVLARTEGSLMLAPTVVPDQEQATPSRLHLHASEAELPISCLLVWPRDEKQRTLIEADARHAGRLAVLRPAEGHRGSFAGSPAVRGPIDRLVWCLGSGWWRCSCISCICRRGCGPQVADFGRAGRPPFPGAVAGFEEWRWGDWRWCLALWRRMCLRWLPDLVHVL